MSADRVDARGQDMGSDTASGEGHWVSIADAASELGVSGDTVRRRMKRQELPAKREQRAQGFRWLVRLDGKPPAVGTVADTGAGADTGHPATPPLQASIVSERDELVRELRDQLTRREREASELRAIIARQAGALEQAARLQVLTPTVTPASASGSPQGAGQPTGKPSAPATTARPWWRRLLRG